MRSIARSVLSSASVKSSVNQPVSDVPSTTFVVRRLANSGWEATSVVAEIYGLHSKAALDRILEEYKPDYLEMHVAELALFDTLPLPFVLRVKKGDLPTSFSQQPAYLIQPYSDAIAAPYPSLLAIDTKEDLETALRHPAMKGIALNGSAEIRPGLKDFDGLTEILEALEED